MRRMTCRQRTSSTSVERSWHMLMMASAQTGRSRPGWEAAPPSSTDSFALPTGQSLPECPTKGRAALRHTQVAVASQDSLELVMQEGSDSEVVPRVASEVVGGDDMPESVCSESGAAVVVSS